ncbi:hypothetical protein [Desulfobulbus propionicus]|jgi:hypothetical protein|uniref:hypothetical protein n=1 Tax=Desulfobulbus propionicus TaxID=894 RepID=UPI00146E29D1|nr:hypothetical protein [Desulfobulbus propionicus]
MTTFELSTAVKSHILYNVTSQVMREFDEETELATEINGTIETLGNPDTNSADYEWWLVSSDFAYAAIEAAEIIVVTPYGAIWGRDPHGPLLALDEIVREIMKTIHQANTQN